MRPPHMALSQISYLIFFLILMASSSSYLSSDDSAVSFQFLDVYNSLKLTRDVFSPKSSQPSIQQLNVLNNSSLTFTLHPRYSLPSVESHNNNYTALSLSRLARDQAHVLSRFSTCSPSEHTHHSKHSRHHSKHSRYHSKHSRHHSKHSGHHSRQHSHRRSQSKRHSRSAAYSRNLQCQEKLQQLRSPLISGISLGSGEYFARIGIGSPAKEFFLVLDTGSDITWIQCEPCMDCYMQSDPIFNPKGSSTYRLIPCNSAQCNDLEPSGCSRANNCLYQIAYGDGSITTGDLAADTFSFGASGSVPNVTFGCGHDNEGLYAGSAGLVGVGNAPLSLTSQIKATSFSYCLVDRDTSSVSTLDFNSAPPPDSVLAPMIINPKISTYFYVNLTGIIIGGRPVRIPQSFFQIQPTGVGGVIVDSGTSISRFHPETYALIRDAFRSMTWQLPPAAGISLFDTCYDLSLLSTVSVPTLAFEFSNGQRLSLRASNYVVPVGSGGLFCFAFSETTGPTGIIGNVQQQGTRVTYDLVNRQIGFSPNKC